MATQSHTSFMEIKIHTAKCDSCNKHNTSTMFRCRDCGQQCCTPCWQRKGGDGTHVLNAGDKGWTGERAQIAAVPKRKRVPRKSNVDMVTKIQTKKQSKKRIMLDEEDEDGKMADALAEEIEEGEVVEAPPKKITKRIKKSDISDKRVASTAPIVLERQASPPAASPKFEPEIQAAGDRLLLRALGVQPTDKDTANLAMLIRAVDAIERPSSGSTGLLNTENKAVSTRDAEPQSPLFLSEDDRGLEPSEAVRAKERRERVVLEPRSVRKGVSRLAHDDLDRGRKDNVGNHERGHQPEEVVS